MINYKSAFVAIFVPVLFCGAFALGYNNASLKYKAKIAEAEQANASKVLETERATAYGVAKIEAQGLNDKAKINANFNNAINELNGLHNSSTTESQVPNDDRTTTRAQAKCTYKSHQESARNFKELLRVARDCDELAERYNRLLKLYELNKANQLN